MKAITLAIMALMLPTQSFALTMLCVETGSTGFNWREGGWVPTVYAADQYIVQDVSEDATLGTFCEPKAPTKTEFGSSTGSRCFNLSVVGEEKSLFSTSTCRVLYEDDLTTVSTVYCDGGGYAQYKFNPTGEFVLTRTYAVPDVSTADGQRDSLVLSVGKCSVVAP